MRSKLPRDPALPKEVPEAQQWLRAVVGRLNSLIPRQNDTINSMVDGYLLQMGSLPTPGEDHRGRMAILRGGPGTADRLYWCRKTAADAYEWKEVV